MRFLLVVLAVALAAPVAAYAQEPARTEWPIASGSRVRILSPVLGDKRQVGVAVSATRDTVVFRRGAEATLQSIGTPDIRQIEIAQGTHGRKLKGALWGFAIGAAAGAALGAATYTTKADCFPCGGRGGNAAFGALTGGIPGTIVGALIGARRTDTWVRVPVPVP